MTATETICLTAFAVVFLDRLAIWLCWRKVFKTIDEAVKKHQSTTVTKLVRVDVKQREDGK